MCWFQICTFKFGLIIVDCMILMKKKNKGFRFCYYSDYFRDSPEKYNLTLEKKRIWAIFFPETMHVRKSTEFSF